MTKTIYFSYFDDETDMLLEVTHLDYERTVDVISKAVEDYQEGNYDNVINDFILERIDSENIVYNVKFLHIDDHKEFDFGMYYNGRME